MGAGQASGNRHLTVGPERVDRLQLDQLQAMRPTGVARQLIIFKG